MSIRLVAAVSLIAVAALASGCVQERVVHDRPVYVQQPPAQHEYVEEVVAPRAPPPVIVEQVQPRPGYIWARSYYRWDGRQYVTVRGHWEPNRVGYHYVHPHYEQRRDGWHWRAGVWVVG
jgi:hypothetical protein